MSRITNAFHFTGLAGITVALSLSPAALAKEIHVPGDYSKIQTAIQNANNGDVIIVHPDDYLEHLNLMGRAITVRSIDPTDPGIVKTTRIIGPGPKATVTCDTGEGVQTSIIGFTIMHQDPPSDYASGMYNDHAAPTVRYCVFAENHADYGGGMHNYYSDPKVANCTFDDNVGVAGGGGMYNDHSAPGVTDCHFIGNDTGPDFNGAGMHNVNSHVTVTECTFTSNRSDGRGGGMYNLDSDVTVTSCGFTGNECPYFSGAGIYSMDSNLTLNDCDFTENDAYGDGGALYQSYGSLVLTDCTFTDNVTDDLGGGMYLSNCNLTMTNCVFDGDYNDNNDSIGGRNWSVNTTPPPAAGACCLPGGVCMIGAESDCIDAGGTYMGDDTDCQTADCPDPCPGDVNGDGKVNIDDIFVILAAWGPCP